MLRTTMRSVGETRSESPRWRVGALALLLLGACAYSGCTLFLARPACDAETPCPDGLGCGEVGF